MAPQDKAHELMLAKQRSTPYTYPPSYPSITYGTGTTSG